MEDGRQRQATQAEVEEQIIPRVDESRMKKVISILIAFFVAPVLSISPAFDVDFVRLP